MPLDKSINRVLVIGSGPIVIGQACEFDYSGTQACKALKEEGCIVILVNSNPASIMTDQDVADHIYIEPIHLNILERVIQRHQVDALLPTMGGQTALNMTVKLHQEKILEKYQVRLIGMQISAIEVAEDRRLFKQRVESLGFQVPRSVTAKNWKEAIAAKKEIGFPLVVRTFFTLGGEGGGIAHDDRDLSFICSKVFNLGQSVLLEESILGWKEYELEIVCDNAGNSIVVCGIENFDPMGVHTGDSITVAPIQTLTDKEYQRMRFAAFSLMKAIGMTSGGCNVQFAIHPQSGKMHCIEINPRVSRSSALASKATGFPIARVSAKTALGYNFNELQNPLIKGKCSTLFEPSLDYVVTKIPRFNFEKFPQVDRSLTTHMKSVGEVMAIGKNFLESIQKAIHSLDLDKNRMLCPNMCLASIRQQLQVPSPESIFLIIDALRLDLAVDEIHDITKCDPWFLFELQELVLEERKISAFSLKEVDVAHLFAWKQMGFSDAHLAYLLSVKEEEIRRFRWAHGIVPTYKRVDACAAEFPTATAYFYSTYQDECEANISRNQKIVVLGSGPNRIGQGIEFDYCCVHAAKALRELECESIMVNCNPETVSTDYDISNRLYLEPLTVEHVLEILKKESPSGVVVQMGGQTSLKLANSINQNGFSIIGTPISALELAEDREKFRNFLKTYGLKQPRNDSFFDAMTATQKAKEIGFPVVVRPSFVIGGQAIQVLDSKNELDRYVRETDIQLVSPVLIEEFVEDAIEVEVDAICDGEQVFCCGIITHLDPMGVHSGDSASLLFSYGIKKSIEKRILAVVEAIGIRLKIVGFFNLQLAIRGEEIMIIEINPRASRTIPLLSKVTGFKLVQIAVKCMLGVSLFKQNLSGVAKDKIRALKLPVFPFSRLNAEDKTLGVQMKSTGEVLCVGRTLDELWMKALLYMQSGVDFSLNKVQKLQKNSLKTNFIDIYSVKEYSATFKK